MDWSNITPTMPADEDGQRQPSKWDNITPTYVTTPTRVNTYEVSDKQYDSGMTLTDLIQGVPEERRPFDPNTPLEERTIVLKQGEEAPSLVQRGINFMQRLVGVQESKPRITPGERAEAVMRTTGQEGVGQLPSRQEAVSESAPRFGVAEQITGNYMIGLIPGLRSIHEVVEGEKFVRDPEGTVQELAAGGARFAGMITGLPGKVAHSTVGALVKRFPGLKVFANTPFLGRLAGSLVTEGLTVSTLSGLASLDDALEQKSIGDATKVLAKSAAEGATIGTIFGGSRAILPNQNLISRIGRIAGVVTANELRHRGEPEPQTPSEKISRWVWRFADVYFAWNGLARKGRTEPVQRVEELPEGGYVTREMVEARDTELADRMLKELEKMTPEDQQAAQQELFIYNIKNQYNEMTPEMKAQATPEVLKVLREAHEARGEFKESAFSGEVAEALDAEAINVPVMPGFGMEDVHYGEFDAFVNNQPTMLPSPDQALLNRISAGEYPGKMKPRTELRKGQPEGQAVRDKDIPKPRVIQRLRGEATDRAKFIAKEMGIEFKGMTEDGKFRWAKGKQEVVTDEASAQAIVNESFKAPAKEKAKAKKKPAYKEEAVSTEPEAERDIPKAPPRKKATTREKAKPTPKQKAKAKPTFKKAEVAPRVEKRLNRQTRDVDGLEFVGKREDGLYVFTMNGKEFKVKNPKKAIIEQRAAKIAANQARAGKAKEGVPKKRALPKQEKKVKQEKPKAKPSAKKPVSTKVERAKKTEKPRPKAKPKPRQKAKPKKEAVKPRERYVQDSKSGRSVGGAAQSGDVVYVTRRNNRANDAIRNELARRNLTLKQEVGGNSSVRKFKVVPEKVQKKPETKIRGRETKKSKAEREKKLKQLDEYEGALENGIKELQARGDKLQKQVKKGVKGSKEKLAKIKRSIEENKKDLAEIGGMIEEAKKEVEEPKKRKRKLGDRLPKDERKAKNVAKAVGGVKFDGKQEVGDGTYLYQFTTDYGATFLTEEPGLGVVRKRKSEVDVSFGKTTPKKPKSKPKSKVKSERKGTKTPRTKKQTKEKQEKIAEKPAGMERRAEPQIDEDTTSPGSYSETTKTAEEMKAAKRRGKATELRGDLDMLAEQLEVHKQKMGTDPAKWTDAQRDRQMRIINMISDTLKKYKKVTGKEFETIEVESKEPIIQSETAPAMKVNELKAEKMARKIAQDRGMAMVTRTGHVRPRVGHTQGEVDAFIKRTTKQILEDAKPRVESKVVGAKGTFRIPKTEKYGERAGTEVEGIIVKETKKSYRLNVDGEEFLIKKRNVTVGKKLTGIEKIRSMSDAQLDAEARKLQAKIEKGEPYNQEFGSMLGEEILRRASEEKAKYNQAMDQAMEQGLDELAKTNGEERVSKENKDKLGSTTLSFLGTGSIIPGVRAARRALVRTYNRMNQTRKNFVEFLNGKPLPHEYFESKEKMVATKAKMLEYEQQMQMDVKRNILSLAENKKDAKNLSRAMSLWIEYNGRPDLVEKYMDKMGDDAPQYVRDAVDRMNRMTQQEVDLARSIAMHISENGVIAERGGVLSRLEDNPLSGFISHMWQQPLVMTETGTMEFWGGGKGKISPKTEFGKERKFNEGFLQGISEGFEPVTMDIADLTRAYGESVWKAVSNKRFIEDLKMMTVNTDNRPALVFDKEPGYEDYVTINSFWLGKEKFVGLKELSDALYARTRGGEEAAKWLLDYVPLKAHPDIGKDLRRFLSPSWFNESAPAFVVKQANYLAKKSLLSFTGFHHIALGKTALFYMDTPHIVDALVRPWKISNEGLELISRQDADINFLMEKGLTLGSAQAADYGQRLRNMVRDWDQYAEGQGIVKKGYAKARKFSQKWDEVLWDKFYRGGKALAAKIEYNRQLHKWRYELADGEISRAEIARRVARDINNNFGGLNLDFMVDWSGETTGKSRSKNAQEASRLLLLAQDWTESNWKFFWQATGGNALKAVKTGKYREALSRGSTVYLSKVVVFTALASNMINYALNGHHMWENGTKEGMEDSRNYMVEVDIGGKKYYVDLFGHFLEPFKYANETFMQGGDPLQKLSHKSSIAGKVIMEQMSGKDWAGRYFATLDDMSKGRFVGRKGGRAGRVGHPSFVETIPGRALDISRKIIPIPINALLGLALDDKTAIETITQAAGLPFRSKGGKNVASRSKSRKRASRRRRASRARRTIRKSRRYAD